MSQETYIPLKFWYCKDAGLALPFCIFPNAQGELIYYDTVHGTSAPLQTVLTKQDAQDVVKQLGGAKL
jgi:hypothetical protein